MSQISIIYTILIFSLIVVVHEWGHFIMARRNGVTVEEFAVGMGPKLVGWTSKKGTLYSLRLFPLGGFCKMTGEEETVDDPGSFSNKSVWARISIVAAGPIMNFVLGMLLLIIINSLMGYTTTTVGKVVENSPAQAAGMEVGDQILEINGKNIHVFNKISFALMDYKEGETVEVVVRRQDGSKETLTMVPQFDEEEQRYLMGFTAASKAGGLDDMVKAEGWGNLPANLWGILKHSFWTLCFDVEMTISGFAQLLTGKVGLDAMSGPIGIVSTVGDVYEQSAADGILYILVNMASLTVLLSANLGVLNLFPIPALDGSRIVFLIVEKIRRKPLNEKIEGMIYTIGFILLIGLMVVVAFNDILKLFG